VDDDSSSAQYDLSSGYLTLTLSKENPGQDFKDLDLLAKLLAPRPAASQPVIEVISGDPGAYEVHDLIAKTEALSLEHDEILQGMIDKFPIVEIREVKSRGY
jgi:protein SHQ1